MEIWLPVVGFEGIYEVSDLGRMRSLPRVVTQMIHGRSTPRRFPGVDMKPTLNEGYPAVTLYRDGTSVLRRVHVLVLEAFEGAPPAGMEGRHLNGDRTDPRRMNLKWGTRGENIRDAVRHGTHQMTRRKRCPRKHPLESPNLVPSAIRRGQRGCWSCQLARGIGRTVKRNGGSFDFQAVSDQYYRALLSGWRPRRGRAAA